MSSQIKQFHKYVSIKKRVKIKERQKKGMAVVQNQIIPILSSLDKPRHPKSDVVVQDYAKIAKGATANVLPGIIHEEKQRKKHKIYSNSVPFGYSKKEYNERLRKAGLKP